MTNDANGKGLLRKKRIVASFSFLLVLIIVGFLTYYLGIKFTRLASNETEFRDFIRGYGTYGIFVAVGLQILQVIIALIPGEVIEIGMGYAYGWFFGTLLCLGGVAIGSSAIFLLVKKFGIRFVEIFVSADKINELKIINSEKKLKRLTFLLFFIPGTPKDLLTYFIGLTRMTLKEFLAITMFARIPSVVSSTVGGNLMGEEKYLEAVIVFVITAAVSLIGIKLYNILIERVKVKSQNLKNKIIEKHNKRKIK